MGYEKNLKRAQEMNLILIKKLVSVCEQYHITYYLDSGALLGAIRHKNFIPWDDDVDIAFLRSDYEKLLRVPKEAWGDDFELVPYDQIGGGEGFLDFITRLVYMKESLPVTIYDKVKDSCKSKYLNHIALDCFVLDNAYDSAWMQKFHKLRLVALYGFGMGHRDHLDLSQYKGISKLGVQFLSAIGRRMSLTKIYEKYQRVSQAAPDTGKWLFYSNFPLFELGVTCKKEWYAESTMVPIGTDEFNAPAMYHEALASQYGDYMQLPPEASRVPLHIREDEC